jgi:hypothetical protein
MRGIVAHVWSDNGYGSAVVDHLQLMVDLNGVDHALRRGAQRDVVVEGILGIRPFINWQFQFVVDVYACNFEHPVDILDIPGDRRHVAVLKGSDLFFGQHRGQCTHHSPTDGADQVIQGGSMLLFRIDIVEFLDSTVYTVIDWLVEPPDVCDPGGAIFACDRDM